LQWQRRFFSKEEFARPILPVQTYHHTRPEPVVRGGMSLVIVTVMMMTKTIVPNKAVAELLPLHALSIHGSDVCRNDDDDESS
jgi:hypothetical protein